MPVLAVEDLHLQLGGRVLFEGAGVSLEPRDRLGLVGPNGSGKSTLLDIIAGELEPDGGRVILGKGCRLGYLSQEQGYELSGTLVESVLAQAPGRDALSDRLAEIERLLSAATDTDAQLALSTELADLHHRLLEMEQAFGPHRAESILMGLGFQLTDLERPVTAFSGGWRMRAALAGILFSQPDVLLLDEPTNHLDFPSVTWLSQFLLGLRGAVILTCHDRGFLNRHVTRVASLELEGLKTFRGNYDEYLEQRELELSHLESRARREEQKQKELEAFVTRFRAKASKARQAQSKAKQIERLEAERVELPKSRKLISIAFAPVERAGTEILRTRSVGHRYGERAVLGGLDLLVRRGDRIAIVGVNGAGKTTLLKILAGELAPSEGAVELGHKVTPSYFAQHHAETLSADDSVLDAVWRAAPDLKESAARGICGAFLFSGDDVDKRIGVLSGGEKTRVALACILASPGNLLLLDEPTNHLDTESADKLTASLEGYDGTLAFVSHDLDFSKRLSNRVWDVAGGTVRDYPGSLAEYVEHLEAEARASSDAPTEAGEERAPSGKEARLEARAKAKQADAELRKRRGALTRQVEAEEAEVTRLEAEKVTLEARLVDPELLKDADRAREATLRYQAVEAALEGALERWTEAQAALEAL